jgi:hypothetical protein
MADKRNTFEPFIRELLGEYGQMFHLSNFAEATFERSHKHSSDLLAKYKKMMEGRDVSGLVGSGTMFSIPLIHNSLLDTGICPPGIASLDEKALALMEELEYRMQAQIWSMAYEVMESFLVRIGSEFYWLKRGAKQLDRKKEFQKKPPRLHKGTPEYFAAFVRWHCSANCASLLRQVCNHVPKLKELLKTNYLNADLIDLYRMVGDVRHKIVHNGGRMDDDYVNGLQFHAFVKPCMRESVLTGEQTFLPTNKNLDRILQHLGAMAFAIYVELSRECGMVVEVPARTGVLFK